MGSGRLAVWMKYEVDGHPDISVVAIALFLLVMIMTLPVSLGASPFLHCKVM